MMLKLFIICSLFLGKIFSIPILDSNSFDPSITFITNSTVAKIQDYPWQVSILYDVVTFKNKINACGGTLINKYWILTAATCIKGFESKDKDIFLGFDSLVSYYNNPNLAYKIDSTIIHPNFNNGTNDVALIKLNKPVVINNKTIKPACFINENNKSKAYKGNLILTAFGSTGRNYYSNTLQKASFEDISFDVNGKIKDPTKIDGKGKGSSTVCLGDFGAPLNLVTESGEKYVVGIASTQESFCKGNSVFTRISYYLDFIKKIVNSPICIQNLDKF